MPGGGYFYYPNTTDTVYSSSIYKNNYVSNKSDLEVPVLKQDYFIDNLTSRIVSKLVDDRNTELYNQFNTFMTRLESIRNKIEHNIDNLLESIEHLKDIEREITKDLSSNYLLIDCLMHCKFLICELLLKKCCVDSCDNSIELIIDTKSQDFITIESIFIEIFNYFPNQLFTNIFFIQLQIFKARDSKNYKEILTNTLLKYDLKKTFHPNFTRILGKLLIEEAILCKNKQSWYTGESILGNCDALDYYRFYIVIGNEVYRLKSLSIMSQQKLNSKIIPLDLIFEFEKERFEKFIEHEVSLNSLFKNTTEVNIFKGKLKSESKRNERKRFAKMLSKRKDIEYILLPTGKDYENMLKVYLKQDPGDAKYIIQDILSKIPLSIIVQFYASGELVLD